MSVSRERVFEVADELDATGVNPTLAAVRKTLGSGSYTTISPFLAEWRAQRASSTVTASEPPPQIIVDHLNRLGGEVWGAALELGFRRFSADREALDMKVSQLEAGLKEATGLADNFSQELETAMDRAAGLEGSFNEALNELEDMRRQIAELTQRLGTAEATSVEREKRAGDLHAELARVTIQNKELVLALTGAVAGRETAP